MEDPASVEALPRRDDAAPWQIQDWLEFPYKFFTFMYGSKSKSVLDIACGENQQRRILESGFQDVTSAELDSDVLLTHPEVIPADITLLPMDWIDTFDVAMSFETIEHVKRELHDQVVSNLLSVARETVVIGSVNLTGPSHIDDVEIWKGELNPHHVAEHDAISWRLYFDRYDKPVYWHSEYHGGGQWTMEPGLSTFGLSNYVVLRLTE